MALSSLLRRQPPSLIDISSVSGYNRFSRSPSGPIAKLAKATVCKTVIRRFESGSGLVVFFLSKLSEASANRHPEGLPVSLRAGIATIAPVRTIHRDSIRYCCTYPARQETGPPGGKRA
jgi:hypothetical protein